MTRSRRLSTTLLLLTATSLAGVALAAPGGTPGPNPNAPGQSKQANGPTISTADGPVRGFTENGVNKFLGIPYAAPPVGALRWMPPQPPAKHSLLDATEFANTCPQVTELGAFAGPSSTNEDCLYLNVFTTGTGGRPKPVLVWIHGGGNFDGETNDYDGSKVATGGPLGTPHLTQSKGGTSSIELGRRLGVTQTTAWKIKHKLMQAMMERDATKRLTGRIEIDDAYLGGERNGGKRGRGSPGKTPIVAAVETTPEGKPI